MPLQNLMINQYLGLLPARYWRRAKDPFVYAIDFTPATLSVTTNGALTISGDADFCLIAQVRTAFATDNTTVVAAPGATVNIQDAGTGRFWNNTPVQIDNWFGTAQLPFVYAKPKLLLANSTLTIAVADLTGISRNIRLAFHGFKIFPYPEENPTAPGQNQQ